MLAVKDPQPDFELPPHNEAALARLREANDHEDAIAYYAGDGALDNGGVVHPAYAYKERVRIEKIARLKQVATLLLEEFKSKGIQIFPVIEIQDKNPIDLFIRFPGKTHLFISIRSKGDSSIVYNEVKEVLQVRRKKNRLGTWQPCPLVELGDYKSWLDKNRAIFGMSSREAQKTPTARVLVLWNPTKASPNHSEHLYTEIGQMKVLVLKRKGSAFVIRESEVSEFVRNWLSKYE
jgi:hypothetical protein